MPAESVMVKNSVFSADFVRRGYEPRRGRIQEKLDERLGPPHGQNLVAALDACVVIMDDKKLALAKADSEHAREKGDDPGVRDFLHLTIGNAKTVIGTTRNVGLDTYGPAFIARLNLVGELPRDAAGVLQVGRILLDALEQGGDKLPEPVIPGYAPALTALMTPLREALNALDAALATYHHEIRELEVTQQGKNQAIDEFEEVFDLTAGMIAATLRLAGDAHLADRLKPSSRRRGVANAVEAGETELPDPDADAPAAPAQPGAPAAEDESAA